MIAAVVVTFSAPADVLDRCVRALCHEGGIERVVVVDTGGAATIGEDLGDVVELVRMENRGYGAAANLGFGMLDDAETVVLLNDDVVVQPGWLSPLVAELETGGVGAAQPVLVGADHTVVTSLGVQLDRYGAGSDIGDGDPMPADRSPTDLAIFTGGTVAFDPAFLRATSGFDETLFLYYEDIDLAIRGRRLGWSYRLVPASVVEHRRGTTTGGDVDGTRFHQERNRLRMAFRYGDLGTIRRAVWLSVRRLRYEPRSVHRRAMLAGLGTAPRALLARLRGLGRRTARR